MPPKIHRKIEIRETKITDVDGVTDDAVDNGVNLIMRVITLRAHVQIGEEKGVKEHEVGAIFYANYVKEVGLLTIIGRDDEDIEDLNLI